MDTALYYELQREPHRLEALVGRQPENTWVVLDEIQKVPALLDEVHRLMADRGWRFALCGSSARQLKKTSVNLLAGRALTLSMAPFSAAELGERFNLASALEYGLMPIVQLDRDYAAATLRAYVDTYIKEEIRQEGVVWNLPPFLRFLALAGQLNGEPVNGQNLARDAGIGRSTVEAYFTILTDTLLGSMLPAWQPRIKVRERTHPKFYWFDCGVARAEAGLLDDRPDRTWLGHALETYILHECRVRNVVSGQAHGFYYYGLPAGGEIDLIIETRRPQPGQPARVIAVGIKMAEKWDRNPACRAAAPRTNHGVTATKCPSYRQEVARQRFTRFVARPKYGFNCVDTKTGAFSAKGGTFFLFYPRWILKVEHFRFVDLRHSD